MFNSNYKYSKYLYKRELSKNTYEIFCARLNSLKELFNNLKFLNVKTGEKCKVIESNF